MEEHFYEWGNQNNPTLAFLHGMGGTGLNYGDLAHYFEDDFHVVTFNLPGHGGAKAFEKEQNYYPTEMAKWIKEKLENLGETAIYLGGHSWGAHLALYVAAMYPELVKGLILLDGGYFQKDPSEESEEQTLKNVEAYHQSLRFPSKKAFLEYEKKESTRWSTLIEAGVLAQVTEINGEIRLVASPFTVKAVIKGMEREPTAMIFSKVISPVLLLHSTLPQELNGERYKRITQFKKGVPQAIIHSIPSTTHNIYYDAPETVANHIKKWVNE